MIVLLPILTFVWGTSMLYKLMKGYTIWQSFNPFFWKDRKSVLLEALYSIEKMQDEREDCSKFYGKVSIKCILNDEIYYFVESKTGEGAFSDKPQGQGGNEFHLANLNIDQGYFILEYEKQVFVRYKVLKLFFEFEDDSMNEWRCRMQYMIFPCFSGIYWSYESFMANIEHKKANRSGWWFYWNGTPELKAAYKRGI